RSPDNGALHRQQVQAVPPGGHEALPQGTALLHGQVRGLAARLPAGRPRPAALEDLRLRAAPPREAEAETHLRRAGAPVPLLHRRGRAHPGQHGRDAARAARAAPGQRGARERLRPFAQPRTPDDQPRPFQGEQPPRGRGLVHGAPRGQGRRARQPEDQEDGLRGRRGEQVADRARLALRQGRASRDRGPGHAAPRPRPAPHPGTADHRAVLEVGEKAGKNHMRIRWRNFELPSRVTPDADTLTNEYGRFMVEPFERGFGHTIGNGLRRVLLSSIEGTAVTAVRIEGADHEFASLEGVYEDVTDVILNIKRLRIRHPGTDRITCRIKRSGKGPVTGADVECPGDTQVINRDLVIANLTLDRALNIELEVSKGRGYVPA